MAANGENVSSNPMDVDVSDAEVEAVEKPGAPTAEEVEALKEVLKSVGTSLAAAAATTTSDASGGAGPHPSLSSSSTTPPTRFSYESPELLGQLQQFFSSQGVAKAPQQLAPPALSPGVPGPSRLVSAVPVLPPVLVAPAAPLPVMPRQAPAPSNVLLGAAMAASSPVLDLERLVTNQALMACHQHQQSCAAQLKAAEAKIVISGFVLVAPENK